MLYKATAYYFICRILKVRTNPNEFNRMYCSNHDIVILSSIVKTFKVQLNFNTRRNINIMTAVRINIRVETYRYDII